tara:strand:- start:33536 stop:33757 length:222 start_codon:yes stop_codon:yes gene_type:complete
MKVKNIQKDALESSISLGDFGNAMKQLDLESVSKEKAAEAIKDHLMKVMADTIKDKQKAQEIHISRILRRNKT